MKKNKKINSLISAIVIIAVGFLYVFGFIDLGSNSDKIIIDTDGKLIVHYIDVGQGDSMLLQADGMNMLIDAGSKSAKDELLNYLDNLDIKKLDYIIATHPHEDHIGNMSYVIDKYDIGTIYAPKKTTTTDTYKAMIKAISNADKKITVAKAGKEFIFGNDVHCQIVAPNSTSYDDTNNYSVVMKVTFGKTSFLFTGDAEKESEDQILENNFYINSDVLKLGHHGSTTSTTDEFLMKVDPKIAIITVGEDNDYGHPHKEIIDKLEKENIQIFRTDKDGTIVLESDGEKIINLRGE
ncbi:ComEC/Rec2 family competence protein [Clostridium sp. DL1XJH146]